MAKIPKIRSAHDAETRNIINKMIDYLNSQGYTYEQLLNNADEILRIAKNTNEINDNTMERLDNILNSQTKENEVIDARLDTKGKQHAVLGNRLNRNEMQQQVTPVLETYESEMRNHRTILLHDDEDKIYYMFNRTGAESQKILHKMDVTGRNVEEIGPFPFSIDYLYKIHATGTLIVTEHSNPAISNDIRIARSVDDGATWENVGVVLNFPPLSNQGITEMPNGNILIGEYGNVGQTVYRVMLSEDDGANWRSVLESPGTDPWGDPGHFHSVTFDHIERCALAFMDRPHNSNYGGRIYKSYDGVSWDLVGETTDMYKPNFVSPMYFETHIAWGYDNERNGVISRMSRENFYNGDWDVENIEDIVKLDNKVFYYAFPVRPDIWVVSMATEFLKYGEHNEGEVAGNGTNELYVVSDNGSVVSGGLTSYYRNTPLFNMGGHKSDFPSYKYDRVDHLGHSWANIITGTSSNVYTATPYSVGLGLPSKKLSEWLLGATPLENMMPLKGLDSDGRSIGMLNISEYGSVELSNHRAGQTRPLLRFTQNGQLQFRSGGQIRMTLNEEGIIQPQIIMASNDLKIVHGYGSPNGKISAHPGSIYLNGTPGATSALWVKVSGTGNVGWKEAGNYSVSGGARPSSPEVGTNIFDAALGRPIWWNGENWVDATGASV